MPRPPGPQSGKPQSGLPHPVGRLRRKPESELRYQPALSNPDILKGAVFEQGQRENHQDKFSLPELYALHLVADPFDSRPLAEKAQIAGITFLRLQQLLNTDAFLEKIEPKARLMAARAVPVLYRSLVHQGENGHLQSINTFLNRLTGVFTTPSGMTASAAKAEVTLSLRIVGLDQARITQITGGGDDGGA